MYPSALSAIIRRTPSRFFSTRPPPISPSRGFDVSHSDNEANRKIELLYFDAGGGHRSAALALQAVFADRYPSWHIEMVNVQDILANVVPLARYSDMEAQDLYNRYIKTGFTYGSGVFLRTLQTGIRLLGPQIEKRFQEHWENSNPALVVSLIPNFNRPMFRGLKTKRPETPYVTIMTDMADSPPHFWLERQKQFVVCATEMAVRQAKDKGYNDAQIYRSSGMIIKPSFYADKPVDRDAGRINLGLDPDRPTALIMFGGYGSKAALRIVDRLSGSKLGVQCIVMCGHNDSVREALAGRAGVCAVGFTNDVRHYMSLADFFIGKPGPGCISEAIHMGLPVILERNARTLYQERYNARWVTDQKLGLVIGNFADIEHAVAKLLQENLLSAFRANAKRLRNEAVFEIPEMLMSILGTVSDAGKVKARPHLPAPIPPPQAASRLMH